MTGMKRGDVLQNMMTYGLFTGALVMHYGAEKAGILVIPSGPGNTNRQIMLMRDFKTTAIHITPSYILYLADALEKKGIDPQRDLSLKRAFVGAEPYSEETRKKIEDTLGIDVYNSYGLTEMNGPGVAFECEWKQGMHIWEDNFLIEIIFSLDGMGLLGFDAILNRDYPIMFGTLYMFSLLGLVLNLVSDVTYTLVDPRIDFERRDV